MKDGEEENEEQINSFLRKATLHVRGLHDGKHNEEGANGSIRETEVIEDNELRQFY